MSKSRKQTRKEKQKIVLDFSEKLWRGDIEPYEWEGYDNNNTIII